MTESSEPPGVQIWLNDFLARHGAVSGTVHFRAKDGPLTLAASVQIPPPVLSVIQTIPEGKGMAGLAWQRDEPVSTCNLQTDATGDVRPGAKSVGAQAAVALPIHEGGTVSGVVGLAYLGEKVLSPEDLARLGEEAETIPRASQLSR
jgi:hypothetical protein